MRLVIGLIILGTFRLGNCQPIRTVNQDSCKKAIERANNNAKSGIFKTFHWGLSTEFDYYKFYANYIATKFGIEWIDKGCIIEASDECYDNQMRKIIRENFGVDFFIKTDRQIRDEYQVFKTLDTEQRKRYINFDFVYKIVDQGADFVQGREELIKELHKLIDFSKINFTGRIVGLHLIIGQTGTVEKCQVISNNFSRDDAEKIENAVKGLGSWTPARLYGFDVKSEKIIVLPTTVE